MLLLPPFGYEELRTHRCFRRLAEELAREGLAALVLEYPGTGDSTEKLADQDQLSRWSATVNAGLDYLRSSGMTDLGVIGMRLGATILSHALREVPSDLRAVVLWDPCTSGRAFLRAQQVLRTVTPDLPPVVDPGLGLEAIGLLYPPGLIAELRTLRLEPPSHSPESGPAPRCLVLFRTDTGDAARLQRVFEGVAVEWAAAEDQRWLLDVTTPVAQVPERSLRRVVGWVRGVLGEEMRPIEPPPGRTSVTIGKGPQEITERLVQLGTLGLFGVVTEPTAPARGPWICFLNVATANHIGPGRTWVQLSRQLAQHGLRCLRFDLSGVGDSPVRPGQAEDVVYAPEWLEDLSEVLAAFGSESSADAVLVGVCSGACAALEAALWNSVRGVCAVNPALTADSQAAASRGSDLRRRTGRLLTAPLVRLSRTHRRLAWSLWRGYRQFAVHRAPMAVLASVVRAGTDTLVLVGEQDSSQFREVLYWRRFGTSRLKRTGRLQLRTEPEIDHALLAQRARDRFAEVLTQHLLEAFVGVDAVPSIPGPAAARAAGTVRT